MKRSEFIVSPPAVELPQSFSELAQEPKPPILAEIPEDETPAPADMLSASPEAPPPDAPPLDIPEPDVPADGLCADALGTDVGAASGAPAATSSEEEKNSDEEKNSEMIVVWRPDRGVFARPGVRDRIQRHRASAPKADFPGTDRPVAKTAPAAARRPSRQECEQEPTRGAAFEPGARQRGRNVAARPPESAEGGEAVRSHEKHRQTARDRDMPHSHPAPGATAKGEGRPELPIRQASRAQGAA